jgi:prephenate dehydrogenase
MSTKKIAIIGLGLIGGSLALSIKNNTSYYVCGIDINTEVIAKAIESGAIDEGHSTPEFISDADIIIISLYPTQSIEFIKNNLHLIKKGSIVLDVCGVKKLICDEIIPLAKDNDFIFIGGHPMAGKEIQGFEAASPHLFDGASMILTPSVDCNIEALEHLKKFVSKLGFTQIVITTPQNHDTMIAFTSQLPHILASSYVKSPQSLLHQGYSAGSFKDVSRVASLNSVMWSELFLANSKNLCGEIDALINNLSNYRDAINSNNSQKLQELLKEGNRIKNII